MANVVRRSVVKLAPLALLLVALAAPARAVWGKGERGPDLSDYPELKVPAGNKLYYHAYAEGVQIYRWDGVAWAFEGPMAFLYDGECDDDLVGYHYEGPTWESESGSYVVGAVLKRVTADPDAIPWLLLEATETGGRGVFKRTTYIQRVNTEGGKAPAEPGDYVGEEAWVPYTADYYFYRAKR
jgi:hypothetical protein